MTEYTVVKAGSLHTLKEIINEKIKLGWFPVGGVTEESEGNYLQAMILEK